MLTCSDVDFSRRQGRASLTMMANHLCSFVLLASMMLTVRGFTCPRAGLRKAPNHQAISSTGLSAVSPDVFLFGTSLSVGAMVYLNSNPDVLDNIIERSNKMSEAPSISTKTPSVKASPKIPAVRAKATPKTSTAIKTPTTTPNTKVQEELTTMLKTVTDDIVAKKDTPSKLETMMEESRLNSVFTEPVSDRIKQPAKRKRALFRKLTKKTVMPWRQWSNL